LTAIRLDLEGWLEALSAAQNFFYLERVEISLDLVCGQLEGCHFVCVLVESSSFVCSKEAIRLPKECGHCNANVKEHAGFVDGRADESPAHADGISTSMERSWSSFSTQWCMMHGFWKPMLHFFEETLMVLSKSSTRSEVAASFLLPEASFSSPSVSSVPSTKGASSSSSLGTFQMELSSFVDGLSVEGETGSKGGDIVRVG
jgi:hypothetical protein